MPSNTKHKIAILTSGMSRGSNFTAIRNYFAEKDLPIEISFLIANMNNAPVLEKCKEYSIVSHVISTKKMSDFETGISQLIKENHIELIALCGFMKLLSREFISAIGIPVINIHPALLPKFGGKGMYGMNVHEAVFKAGETYSGATVHLVNEQYDAGQILIQEETDISSCLSPEEIAGKVLRIEHKIYGKAIESYFKL